MPTIALTGVQKAPALILPIWSNPFITFELCGQVARISRRPIGDPNIHLAFVSFWWCHWMLMFHKSGFACIVQHFTPMRNFM